MELLGPYGLQHLGLPDWLFWSQKAEIWLFWEALDSKIFIWLFGYFLALLQLFRSRNFSGRKVGSGTCSLSPPQWNEKQATTQLRNALMSTQVYLWSAQLVSCSAQ